MAFRPGSAVADTSARVARPIAGLDAANRQWRNRQRVQRVPKRRRFVAAQTIADADKASAQAHLFDNPRMNGSAFGLGPNRAFCLRMAPGSGHPGVSGANSRLRRRAPQRDLWRPCHRFERHAQFGNRLAKYISQLLLACTAYRRNAEARRAPILVGSMAKDRFEDHRVEFVLGQRCARLRITLHGIEPRLEGLDVKAREIDNGFAQSSQPLGGK
jgi:hypothetical protein